MPGAIHRPPAGAARNYLLTVGACIATTLLATPLLDVLDLANIVMLFLLTVLLIAVRLGRNPAVLAALLSVLLFDLFFVPPRFSLAVSNLQYLVTFAVMLATALITGQLAAGLKQQAQAALARERQTRALYELARRLAGALTPAEVGGLAGAFVAAECAGQAALLLAPGGAPEAGGELHCETHLTQIALHSGEIVRSDEIGRLGYASLYLPLRAGGECCGVLAVGFGETPERLDAAGEALLGALASLVAVAVERLRLGAAARQAEIDVLSERLRSSILSALSHDLRTPLTAMVGLADSLFLVEPALPAAALETAQALRGQAERLAGLSANLLDMARLNAGQLRLRREWQPLEEVVGSSRKLLAGALAGHRLQVELAPDLPLLEFDAVLIERVLGNLLDNAAKYAPAGSTITLAARRLGDQVEVEVADQGPGFAGDAGGLFDPFVRGAGSAGLPGSGLGLAICRAIVEAHGGRIAAANRPPGGASVRFTLPCGTPPEIEEEA